MQSKYKLTGWHALILILSWEFWRYLSYLFESSAPDFEPAMVLNFILISSVTTLGLMLFTPNEAARARSVPLLRTGFRKKWHALSFGAMHGIFYLVYFGFNPLNLLGVAILIGLLFVSRFQINSELNERFKVNPRAVLRRGLMGVVLGIFVLISFAAYQSPLAKEIERSQQLPSRTEVFIRNIVENTIGPRVDTGSEAEKQSVISQITGETLKQLNALLGPYFQYAPPLLAFAVFLILWGLSWFFIQLSVLVGVLMFWALKKMKIVIIEEHDVKAEALVV